MREDVSTSANPVATAPAGNATPLRIAGVIPGARMQLMLDGHAIEAHEGESIAAAMWQAGVRGCRVTRGAGQPRGYYCGMGVCFECVVHVVGVGDVRACRTPVGPDMQVRTSL